MPRFLSGPFVEEPPWPHFATWSSRLELPFAPDWMRGSQVHSLFPHQELDPAIRQTLRVRENRTQLSDWLNFDLLDEFSEYQGALCLVAPNPLFRTVAKAQPDTSTDVAGEIVAYKPIARHAQRLHGCRLEVTNDRLRGRLARLAHEFDDDAIGELRHPTERYKEGISITHPTLGLLHWNDPCTLVKTVRLGTEIAARTKRVVVPARGKRRPEYTHDVHEREHAAEIVVGDVPANASVVSRLVAADLTRHRRREAEKYDQKWFHLEHSNAAAWVRKKIGRARETVFIVDPYFAGPELFAFGHAIARNDVALRVLTSQEAFDHDYSAHDLQTNLAASFSGSSTPPEIRVLTGEPDVHDRFLVIDNQVWLSGNSLNTLGERAGMVIRLPDPDPVIPRLEGFWDGATPLANWLATRPPARTPHPCLRFLRRLLRRSHA